jgi:hypothetical protein
MADPPVIAAIRSRASSPINMQHAIGVGYPKMPAHLFCLLGEGSLVDAIVTVRTTAQAPTTNHPNKEQETKKRIAGISATLRFSKKIENYYERNH